MIGQLAGLWHGMGPETKNAVIQAAATLSAAGVGVIAILNQIRSQAKQNRDTIAESEKRKIKARMFEDATQRVQRMGSEASSAVGAIYAAIQEINIEKGAADIGRPWNVGARWPPINEKLNAAQEAATEVIGIVEQNRIIDPRIGIFQDAISSATHDLREAISKKYVPAMLPTLPHDNPNGGIFPRATPTDAMIESLEAATNDVAAALNDLTSYGQDLQVELQNHLLGDLFKTTVEHRRPIDPKCKVIRLADSEALKQHFWNATAWGQSCQEAESRARAQNANKDG